MCCGIKMTRRSDPQKVQEAYSMIMEGHSVDAVASRLGVHRVTVYRYLVRVKKALPSLVEVKEMAVHRLLHFLNLFSADFHAADIESPAKARAAANIVLLLKELDDVLGLKGSRDDAQNLVQPQGPGIRITNIPIDKALEEGRAKMKAYMKEKGML